MPAPSFIPRIIAFLGYSPYDTESGPLGKRIVACRRAKGLTQKELARRLDVDPSTVGRWWSVSPVVGAGTKHRSSPSAREDQTTANRLWQAASQSHQGSGKGEGSCEQEGLTRLLHNRTSAVSSSSGEAIRVASRHILSDYVRV